MSEDSENRIMIKIIIARSQEKGDEKETRIHRGYVIVVKTIIKRLKPIRTTS